MKAQPRSLKSMARSLTLLEARVDSMTQTLSSLIDMVHAHKAVSQDIYQWLRLHGNRTFFLQGAAADLKLKKDAARKAKKA